MYKQVFKKLKEIGQHTSDIECILIVGSVARGTNIMGSYYGLRFGYYDYFK